MSLYRLIGRSCDAMRKPMRPPASCCSAIAVLIVWIPRQIGQVVDGLVANRLLGAALLQELAWLLAAGFVVYFLRVGWRLKLYAAAYRLGVELRERLYARLALQGAPFFQDRRTGNLMALATNDIDAVEMAAGEAMLAGFDGTLTLVLVVAMMSLGVDGRLAACALLPFPLMALGFWRISRHVHEASRLSLERFGALNDHVQETLAGVRTVRALGLQARSEAQFSRLASGAAQASLDAQRWEAAYEPAVGFTLAAATVLTLGVGGWLVWQDQLTVGQLTSFSLYLGQLIWPMFAAGWVLSLLERGKAAWGRLQPVLDAPLSVDDHGTTAQVTPGPLVAAGRALQLPGPAAARAGWRVAASAAGPHAGPGGADRRRQVHPAAAAAAPPRAGGRQPAMERASTCRTTPWTPCAPRSPGCRRRPSCSPPRWPRTSRWRAPTRPASRSSRRRGSRPCTKTSCACRRATTRRWASAASPCPAGSASASRSPARCWPMRRCCCWTTRLSAVDTDTEARILAHLREARVGRTVIIVSHRLSAVADADATVVLREGRVVEQGSHAALLAANGWYARQWRYQQLEASLDAS